MTREALSIQHNPPGYRMKFFVSELDEHVVLRTGELCAIALDEKEVKRVVEWLQGWLDEGKEGTHDPGTPVL